MPNDTSHPDVATAEIIRRLKNLRRKWRREETRERKFQSGETLGRVPGALSLEKSRGILIGYMTCSDALDRLIRELEEKEKANAK